MSKQTHHLLTIEERIKFYNDMVDREQVLYHERHKDFMVQEFVTWHYYQPESFGHKTDDDIHRYMDQKNVPWRVQNDLWAQYKASV